MAAPRPPKLLSVLLQLLLLSRVTRGDDTPLFPAWLERLYPGLGDSVQLTCEGSFDASLHADVLSRCVRITGSLTVTGLIPDTLSTREPYNRVLRTVDGDVLIERNRVLTSLRGAFPGLVSVGGDVRVVDTGLVYLTGFESLSTVDGTVLVVDNARMLGFGDGVVTAFSALIYVGGESIFMFVRAIRVMTPCFVIRLGGDIGKRRRGTGRIPGAAARRRGSHRRGRDDRTVGGPAVRRWERAGVERVRGGRG